MNFRRFLDKITQFKPHIFAPLFILSSCFGGTSDTVISETTYTSAASFLTSTEFVGGGALDSTSSVIPSTQYESIGLHYFLYNHCAKTGGGLNECAESDVVAGDNVTVTLVGDGVRTSELFTTTLPNELTSDNVLSEISHFTDNVGNKITESFGTTSGTDFTSFENSDFADVATSFKFLAPYNDCIHGATNGNSDCNGIDAQYGTNRSRSYFQAAIIAAQNNNAGIQGMAYNAKIQPVRLTSYFYVDSNDGADYASDPFYRNSIRKNAEVGAMGNYSISRVYDANGVPLMIFTESGNYDDDATATSLTLSADGQGVYHAGDIVRFDNTISPAGDDLAYLPHSSLTSLSDKTAFLYKYTANESYVDGYDKSVFKAITDGLGTTSGRGAVILDNLSYDKDDYRTNRVDSGKSTHDVFFYDDTKLDDTFTSSSSGQTMVFANSTSLSTADDINDVAKMSGNAFDVDGATTLFDIANKDDIFDNGSADTNMDDRFYFSNDGALTNSIAVPVIQDWKHTVRDNLVQFANKYDGVIVVGTGDSAEVRPSDLVGLTNVSYGGVLQDGTAGKIIKEYQGEVYVGCDDALANTTGCDAKVVTNKTITDANVGTNWSDEFDLAGGTATPQINQNSQDILSTLPNSYGVVNTSATIPEVHLFSKDIIVTGETDLANKNNVSGWVFNSSDGTVFNGGADDPNYPARYAATVNTGKVLCRYDASDNLIVDSHNGGITDQACPSSPTVTGGGVASTEVFTGKEADGLTTTYYDGVASDNGIRDDDAKMIIVAGYDNVSGKMSDFTNQCGTRDATNPGMSSSNYCLLAPSNTLSENPTDGKMQTKSDTNVAAAHVAGAVALIEGVSAKYGINITAQQISDVLFLNALQMTGTGRALSIGTEKYMNVSGNRITNSGDVTTYESASGGNRAVQLDTDLWIKMNEGNAVWGMGYLNLDFKLGAFGALTLNAGSQRDAATALRNVAHPELVCTANGGTSTEPDCKTDTEHSVATTSITLPSSLSATSMTLGSAFGDVLTGSTALAGRLSSVMSTDAFGFPDWHDLRSYVQIVPSTVSLDNYLFGEENYDTKSFTSPQLMNSSFSFSALTPKAVNQESGIQRHLVVDQIYDSVQRDDSSVSNFSFSANPLKNTSLNMSYNAYQASDMSPLHDLSGFAMSGSQASDSYLKMVGSDSRMMNLEHQLSDKLKFSFSANRGTVNNSTSNGQVFEYHNETGNANLEDQFNKAFVSELDYALNNKTTLNLSMGSLDEASSFLDSKGSGAFVFGDGAQTDYYTIGMKRNLGSTINAVAQYSHGFTDLSAASNSIFTKFSNIQSNSFLFGLTADTKNRRNSASFGLLYSQPLRISAGQATLYLEDKADLDGDGIYEDVITHEEFSLIPSGREQNLEAFYNINLDQNSYLGLNFLTRFQPGHDKEADNEYVGLINFGTNF